MAKTISLDQMPNQWKIEYNELGHRHFVNRLTGQIATSDPRPPIILNPKLNTQLEFIKDGYSDVNEDSMNFQIKQTNLLKTCQFNTIPTRIQMVIKRKRILENTIIKLEKFTSGTFKYIVLVCFHNEQGIDYGALFKYFFQYL